MSGKAEEKRQYRRIAYHETVLINDSLQAQCNDLSEGGLFVHTARALLPGSEVSVTFPETGLKVAAEVKVVPKTGGLGLMFKDLDDMQAAEVREIMRLAEERGRLIESEKTTVLIVEDCVQGACYRKKLAEEGYHVVRASNGAEAVKMLGANVPDAVVLDMQAKVLNGYSVLEAIMSAGKSKKIPVVAYSGIFTPVEKSRAVEAGASTLLPKTTTSPARLTSILKKFIGQ